MLTYEDVYNDLNSKMKFEVPFKNLKYVNAIIPDGIYNAIETRYIEAIKQKEFDGTFDEFVGIIILGGLACKKIIEAMTMTEE